MHFYHFIIETLKVQWASVEDCGNSNNFLAFLFLSAAFFALFGGGLPDGACGCLSAF